MKENENEQKCLLEVDTNETMQLLASIIRDTLMDKYGFALMVFPFNDKDGTVNYISNAERESMIHNLRLTADILEKREDIISNSNDIN